MVKILIAPDSFKESSSSIEVANSIEIGLLDVFGPQVECIKLPMADGGEGTVSALVAATKGKLVKKTVTGPLGKPVEAFFGILGDQKTAVIEMAAAAGLHLVPPKERNPFVTTTYGLGELIIEALNYGVTKLIIGLGGSATNDGGAGMIQALGGKIITSEGTDVVFGCQELHKVETIDLSNIDSRIYDIELEVACDVDNPFIGPNGASFIFGPQKGASPQDVETLDQSLTHFATVIEEQLHIAIKELPGAGAAGGLGGAIHSLLGGKLRRGIEIVTNVLRFEEAVKDCDLIFTGEGKIDGQTIYGKTPIGVAKIAQKNNIPVIAIAGTLGAGYEKVYEHGITAAYSIVPGPVSLIDALAHANENITNTTRNIARGIMIGRSILPSIV